MKKFIIKMILVSFILSLAVTLQAEITNVYEWNPTLSALSIQPQARDLTQLPGSQNYIVKGGMHDSAFLLTSLFDSDADGSYGPGANGGIFIDELSPANDTIIHCDFAEAQTVSFEATIRAMTKSQDEAAQATKNWIPCRVPTLLPPLCPEVWRYAQRSKDPGQDRCSWRPDHCRSGRTHRISLPVDQRPCRCRNPGQ